MTQGRFGMLFSELVELGLSRQENRQKDATVRPLTTERIPRASAAAILILCKGK